MKKSIIVALCALLGMTAVRAQQVTLAPVEGVPDAAREVLEQRFTQMVLQNGLDLGEDGALLRITVETTSRMETPGSMSQVAVVLSVGASVEKGGTVVSSQFFSVKGVGADDDDAIVRAVKQILPKSKAAQAFMADVKEKIS